ncbi:hypothetical protein GGX14DRAFT_534821 [Mycena pura]|uniref:Nephrocystin 3-like N-terminal domain-containing protein n=1 Tax=Mycena pura TaxID=153505 RepID=A0AAD6YAD6_9AGAR|nr:hypothetical protein GGX14DRAFT_534821 [Mycena pura]
MEALHNSGERFPEPACHPGTRTTVLDELNSCTILWLHGSAGMGKSAIAQMFAGTCMTQGRLGASFFFRRGHAKRGTWHGLFPTIAYQLATLTDKLFQKLLLEPLQTNPGFQSMPIIVQQILRLFITAIRSQQLPMRLLISSRPEPHICEVLETEEALAICRHFGLSADDRANEDIRTYLRDQFSRIHSDCLAGEINLGAAWPPRDAIESLVTRSSGAFIYATTLRRRNRSGFFSFSMLSGKELRGIT